jgi:hypothetical protein
MYAQTISDADELQLARVRRLTPREHVVLARAAAGETNAEIASAQVALRSTWHWNVRQAANDDRILFLAAASRRLPRSRSRSCLVTPRTLLRWH